MRLPAQLDERVLAERLDRFEIETPSWGYADTGTRFGKFVQDAAAGTWESQPMPQRCAATPAADHE